MIRSIKLKPIMSGDQVLSYVLDDLELNNELIQSYFEYDRKTIDMISSVYRLILQSLYNTIYFSGDRVQEFNRLMREGILSHTYGAIENWKSNTKALLEREQLQKEDHTKVLYKGEIEHLVNINAIDNFSDYTSYLRSEKPLVEHEDINEPEEVDQE